MDNSVSGQHISQVVAPLLAAFTLPTIAVIVVTPPPHWRYAILSLFVASAGLLLAGFQLSVGRPFRDATPWNEVRSILTFLGLITLTAGLALLAASARREDRTGLFAALVILTAGVLVPIGMNIWLWQADRRQPAPPRDMEQQVVDVLTRDRDISHVQLAGSRAAGRAGSLSDWDFEVKTDCLPAVMDRLPGLLTPLGSPPRPPASPRQSATTAPRARNERASSVTKSPAPPSMPSFPRSTGRSASRLQQRPDPAWREVTGRPASRDALRMLPRPMRLRPAQRRAPDRVCPAAGGLAWVIVSGF